MGNAASAAYTKGAEVTFGGPRFRTVHRGHYVQDDESVSIFSYTNDTTLSVAVPEITKHITERVQASRQLMGMVNILESEVTSTGIDLIVSEVTPLSSFQGSTDEILIGLFIIGRTLHRLHTSHNLSHNALSLTSVFVSTESGDWQLTEELCGDFKSAEFLRLLKSATPLLDANYIPPEFTAANAGRTDFSRYPIHARDAFAFSVLVSHFIAQFRLPVSTYTRATLAKMSNPDYTQRPAISALTEDAMFSSVEAIPFLARLMDLRHGLLPEHEAKELFYALPALIKRTGSKKIVRIVLEYINKYSIVVHPAAISTKFVLMLWTMQTAKSQDVSAHGKSGKAPIKGILSGNDYRNVMLPFIGSLWIQDRPGLSVILLRTIGRYVYRMDPSFVRDYILKKMLSMNILLDSHLVNAYLCALPIVLKALLKKNYDVAPLVRHVVQSSQLFAGNDTLRLRALTCLLVHPKIPIILLKEYLARGLTDTSPQIRLQVIKAAKKFGISFSDNSGPMSARCLADAIIGSLVLSMVDVDSQVREKARAAIRKLTYVMERKEDQLKIALQQQPKPATTSSKTSTPKAPPKPTQSTPKTSVPKAENGHDSNFGLMRSSSARSTGSFSSAEKFDAHEPLSPSTDSSWGAWEEWDDDDDGNGFSAAGSSNGGSGGYHDDSFSNTVQTFTSSTPARASSSDEKRPASKFQVADDSDDFETDFEPAPTPSTSTPLKPTSTALSVADDTLDDNWGLEEEEEDPAPEQVSAHQQPASSSTPATLDQPDQQAANTASTVATPSKLAMASTDWEESGWGDEEDGVGDF